MLKNIQINKYKFFNLSTLEKIQEEKVNLAKRLDERTKKYQGKFMDKLVESVKPDRTPNSDKIKIYDKNVKINKNIDSMIDDINKMLDEQ